MAIKYNNNNITEIKYNNNNVTAVYYNGVKVWPDADNSKYYIFYNGNLYNDFLLGDNTTIDASNRLEQNRSWNGTADDNYWTYHYAIVYRQSSGLNLSPYNKLHIKYQTTDNSGGETSNVATYIRPLGSATSKNVRSASAHTTQQQVQHTLTMQTLELDLTNKTSVSTYIGIWGFAQTRGTGSKNMSNWIQEAWLYK